MSGIKELDMTTVLDNNDLRQITRGSIKEFAKKAPCFHTFYRVIVNNYYNTQHQESDAVADGQSVPEGAFDIKTYNEGDPMSDAGIAPDGKKRRYVHSHDLFPAPATFGGVPAKSVVVED